MFARPSIASGNGAQSLPWLSIVNQNSLLASAAKCPLNRILELYPSRRLIRKLPQCPHLGRMPHQVVKTSLSLDPAIPEHNNVVGAPQRDLTVRNSQARHAGLGK